MTPEELRTLDRAVAVKLGWRFDNSNLKQDSEGIFIAWDSGDVFQRFHPSEDWSQAGPLLEMMHRPTVQKNYNDDEWVCHSEATGTSGWSWGETPHIAICKAFVNQP